MGRVFTKTQTQPYSLSGWAEIVIPTYTYGMTIALRVCSGSISFFLREFQPIASTLDDSSLLSDQDINRFFK